MSSVSTTPPGFERWIGRQTQAEDVVGDRLVASFRAIFGSNLVRLDEELAPLGIHWCLCPAIAGMAELGPDGHPAKNLDFPPIPLPRRMWAGGQVQTFDPLRVGDRVQRVSTIAGITRKEGRSGELWFLNLEHDYSTQRGPALRERIDLVYREAARRGPPLPKAPFAPAEPDRRRGQVWTIATSTTLLFRYSAITFNGHRIHYDFPYATAEEGYDGLVVHGPIQATLLLNLAATTSHAVPPAFRYRGVAPAIAGGELKAIAGTGEMEGAFWTEGSGGTRHMEASVLP